MTNEEIMQALIAWVPTVVPEVDGHVYDRTPTEKELALPDAMVQLLHESIQDGGGAQFPWLQIQQAEVRILDFGISFTADAGNSGAEESAADAALRAIAQKLLDACRSGSALGSHELIGVRPSFDYAPPFVVYEDGTRGRELTANVSVAQLLEVVSA